MCVCSLPEDCCHRCRLLLWRLCDCAAIACFNPNSCIGDVCVKQAFRWTLSNEIAYIFFCALNFICYFFFLYFDRWRLPPFFCIDADVCVALMC